MPNYADPNLDFALEEQLQKAKWLRAQEMQDTKEKPYTGMGGHPAPFHWGSGVANTLRGIAGDRNGRQAESTMRGLSAEQIARIEALNQQLNSPQNINWSDPQAIQAENSRRAQIVGQQQRLPMAASSANKVQEQLQRFPETMMAQKQRADEIAARQADQQASYQNMQRQRLDSQTANRQSADQTRLLIAAMNNQTRRDTAGSTGGSTDKRSSKQKDQDEARAVMEATIKDAYRMVDENPDSVGWKTKFVPDEILQRTDPDGVAARAILTSLSADKIHELSGAAVSVAEFARLRPFLPASGDSTEGVKVKLKGMFRGIQLIKLIQATGGILPDRLPDGNDDKAWEALLGPNASRIESGPATPAPAANTSVKEPTELRVISTKNGVNLMSNGSYQPAQ